MTEYVRIPIREDEHKRLVALQTEWTGQINSYLTRPSLSDVIKKLLDERKAIDSMTTYSKLLSLTAGSRTNPVHAQIQFSGTLTPAVAIEAAKRAFGHANGVTVKDPETATTYRLTNGKAKNITDPEETIQAETEQEWRRQQATEHMNEFE